MLNSKLVENQNPESETKPTNPPVPKKETENPKKDPNQTKKELKKFGVTPGTIVTCMLILLIFLAVWLPFHLVRKSASALGNQYLENYENTSEDVENKVTDMIYETVENANHSEGSVYVDIDEFKKIAKLEVLRIGHSVITIENKNENSKGLTIWQRWFAHGIYSVDLNLAEVIINPSNQMVIITVPKPELSVVRDYEKTKELLSKEDPTFNFDNPAKVASEMNQKLLQESKEEFNKYFYNNQENDLKAEDYTKKAIERLVKSWNPQESDLNVVVQFY